jgi:hypothetical protein
MLLSTNFDSSLKVLFKSSLKFRSCWLPFALIMKPTFKRSFGSIKVKKEEARKRQTLESDHDREEDTESLSDHEGQVESHMEESESSQSEGETDIRTHAEIEDESDACFEAGIILSVEVQDFMNHKKFTINFGKLFNFVTGHNGAGLYLSDYDRNCLTSMTGKSAIVAAIQLCLGAAAKKSGRAPKYANCSSPNNH